MRANYPYRFLFYCILYVQHPIINIKFVDSYLVVRFEDGKEAVYFITGKEANMLKQAKKRHAKKVSSRFY